MDVAGFRAAYPAFTEALHPDARVAFWLRVAGLRLSAARWGELLDDGMALFVAHHLTLERAAALATDGTGGKLAAAGHLASESKGVGGVSKSKGYAAGTTDWVNAGAWNQTIYGQQFYELMQLIGAGGIQA